MFAELLPAAAPYVASIDLAAGTVRRLADADDLAAIVLETCPSRWVRTMNP